MEGDTSGRARLSVKERKKEGHRGRGEGRINGVWEESKSEREGREEEEKGRVERKRKASVTRNLAYLENSVSSECLKLCL